MRISPIKINNDSAKNFFFDQVSLIVSPLSIQNKNNLCNYNSFIIYYFRIEPRKAWDISCSVTVRVSRAHGPVTPAQSSGCTTTRTTITSREISTTYFTQKRMIGDFLFTWRGTMCLIRIEALLRYSCFCC